MDSALRMGASCALVSKLIQHKLQKILRVRFEKWKFQYLALKEGVQVYTQMRTQHLNYSMDELTSDIASSQVSSVN